MPTYMSWGTVMGFATIGILVWIAIISESIATHLAERFYTQESLKKHHKI